MSQLRPFHIAIPVSNLKEAENFYVTQFKCDIGRRDDHWVDLNFYGHQLVLHVDENKAKIEETVSNKVDDHAVPIPHYGVVLTMEDWQELAERLQGQNMDFIIEPYIRFKGQKGEQATMFFKDPSGNALEFKAFADLDLLFEPFDEQEPNIR